MPAYTQAGRAITIDTPLGKDVLLLTSVKGFEAISRPFHFSLEMLRESSQSVPFAQLLGQPVTVTLNVAGAPSRYINGVVTRLAQGQQVRSADGSATFVRYRAEMAPRFGLLKKRVQNRILQQKTVPQILAEVLAGLDVRFQITGVYAPRDYCVQYRESDFAFASRLMEEEGICYFFEHGQDKHTMVVSDSATSFAELPQQSRLAYSMVSGGPANERRIRNWEKQQDVASGQYLARDHSFELQEHNLEYEQTLSGSVAVGTVSHPLTVGPAKDLTIYEYPGRYAQRFDGMTQRGQPQSESLGKVFDDGPRTVSIRMEQEACDSLRIHGDSDYGHQTPGYAFTLEKHFDGNGGYVLTQVEHSASLGDAYLTAEQTTVLYSNRFECIPKGLTYRPARLTPQPSIHGTQSATVVGLAGEQVFCDKYGRVKVQFRWDRQGQNNERSSCWLRVAQPWAGQGFGSFHLPRVGQEVVVAFEEGDPDKPIIIGSVYNSQNMPPYQLPEQAMYTGLLSRSLNGTAQNASELRIQDDVPGQEQVHFHAEKDLLMSAEDQHHMTVGKGLYVQVGGGSQSASPSPDTSPKTAALTKKGSGSGGGDATKEFNGVTFDVAEGWSRTCGKVKDEIYGDATYFTLGYTENLSIAGELDIYVGNYTFVGLINNVNITSGLTVNVSLNKTWDVDVVDRIRAFRARNSTVVEGETLTVGGSYLVTVGDEYELKSVGLSMKLWTKMQEVPVRTITLSAGLAMESCKIELTNKTMELLGNESIYIEAPEVLFQVDKDLKAHSRRQLVLQVGNSSLVGLYNDKVQLEFGTSTITLTDAGIVLKCGESSITIAPDGITSEAPKVTTIEG